MSKAAFVSNGVVTNVILADAGFAADAGAIACDDNVRIGWAYDGADFSAPPLVGPARLHRGSFATDLLTPAENDAWIALVDAAEQTPVADRTETQKAILRAWRHFTLHEYIERDNVFTQAACMALYVWGVLGPVYDDQSGQPPTGAELTAINRADRIGKFLAPV